MNVKQVIHAKMEEHVPIPWEVTHVFVTTDGQAVTAKQAPISVFQIHAKMVGLVIV